MLQGDNVVCYCYRMTDFAVSTIEEKARKRFTRDCERSGIIYQEPGSVHVDEVERTVELSNVRGLLARYNYRILRNGVVSLTM